jgi:hypothetical protein
MPRLHAAAVSLLAAILPPAALEAPTPAFDPTAYYRLTTDFQGECKSLDIVNDASDSQPILAKTARVSGQLWRITPEGNGYVRLSTQWLGTGKSLDIINDATDDRPILAPTAAVSGQLWKITAFGDGYYRLTTQWQGTGKSLDIVNDVTDDRLILAPTAAVSGQRWRITKETQVSVVPASLGLNPFYKKHLDAEGIPIVSSAKVPDAAIHQVRFLSRQMLARLPQVRSLLIARKVRIAVMAKDEVTTDIPEHAFLKNDPATNWDERARGLGATIRVPVSSCAEENLLCYAVDKYKNEDIFIHEFAHTIHLLGLVHVDGFQTGLSAAYANAKQKGLWAGTYAMTGPEDQENRHPEYFAEGVQAWFDTNDQDNTEHNHVNTRAELATYDPKLHELLAKYFQQDSNRCSCHLPLPPKSPASPSSRTSS